MAKGSNNTRNTRKTRQEIGEERIIKEKFKEERVVAPIQAKNQFQKDVLKALKEKQVIVVEGSAGVGKTFLCMGQTSDWFVKGDIDQIILTRPSVGMGNTIGFLKGDLEQKFSPYIFPMLEVFKDRHGRGKLDTAVAADNICFVPLEYMRGRNINGVCIMDEAQGSTPNEMYAVLTRLTENGKLIILGDTTQTDIKGKNGLTWLKEFIEKFDLGDSVQIISATSDDIVRGEFCQRVVKAKESEHE